MVPLVYDLVGENHMYADGQLVFTGYVGPYYYVITDHRW